MVTRSIALAERDRDRALAKAALSRQARADLRMAAMIAILRRLSPGTIVVHQETKREYEVIAIRVKTGSLVLKIPGAPAEKKPQVFRADLFTSKQTA